MRLVVDMQCVQGDSRFRGIGRYATGLARALAAAMASDPDDELFLFVNETMSDAAAQVREDFAGIVAPERIRGFRSVGTTSGDAPDNHERRGVSEVIRESALAVLQPDVVLVMSLFEGFGDSVVTSIGGFVAHLPTATILHDLIPMQLPDQYLADPTMRDWYERKVAALRLSGLLLTNSETSRQQAHRLLQLGEDQVVTIGTGLDAHFRREDPSKGANGEPTSEAFVRFGVARKPVLYAGGFDRRKKVEVLIEAFAGLEGELRMQHQLVLAGRCTRGDLERLRDKAGACGLAADEVVFTGHVTDDELVAFYRGCELFVFPSTHEGFGLPPLEAASCGAPVLAVDTPAMREQQKRTELLVGEGAEALRTALDRVLSDPAQRAALRVPPDTLEGRFDWNRVAAKALVALRRLAERSGMTDANATLLDKARPRLAFVAPLPPAPSGIADYCAELVGSLQAHYAIELIVDQTDVDTSWIPDWIPLRSVQWFEQHGNQFERVLYHFGNSPFHIHMVGLLKRFPGVVVLHDFFLADLQLTLQNQPGGPAALERAVAHSHGPAGQLLEHEDGLDAVRKRMPCNLAILEAADCVIVHSKHATDLARHWYGPSIARKHVAVPFPRAVTRLPERHHARIGLGIEPHELLICSFGMIAPHKLNHLMLDCWDRLDPALRSRARMVFVGANMPGVYGTAIAARCAAEPGRRVEVTGHVSLEDYRTYLASADVVVQLRGESRGETSAAVFDALGAGVVLVVNDHASLSELPSDAVLKLPEFCTADDLSAAIGSLVDDPGLRGALAARGRRLVSEEHSPQVVSRRYAMAIEQGIRQSPRRHAERLERFAIDWAAAASRPGWQVGAMARSVAAAGHVAPQPRLFVDVTAIAAVDLRTGIQRVVRALLLELLRNQPPGLRIEPVRADLSHRVYRHAGRYLSTLLGNTLSDGGDEVLDTQPGDIFLGLDLAGESVTLLPDWFRLQSQRGVRIAFVVYDLLPVTMPEFFPTGMDLAFGHWMKTIGKAADQIFCISDAVADDLRAWLDDHQPLRRRPLKIASFRLGADLGASAPSRGLPVEADTLLESIAGRDSFLMVGTVEPRKGHAQVLDAFDALWADGHDLGLVIVGKVGWMMDGFLAGVTKHPEFGRRLFWLEKISDEFLDRVYPACTALIAASRGEGFGLPLIESARHHLPIIARDLPVFREVAGEHAFYFTGTEASSLADAIREWRALSADGKAPQTDGIVSHTWRESAQQVVRLVLEDAQMPSWHGTASVALAETLPYDSVKLDWEGWSSVEASHRWSDGKRMRIGIPLSRDADVPKNLDLMAGTFGHQTIEIFFNEVPLYKQAVALEDELVTIELPRDAIRAGEQNWIEFRVPDARSPGGNDKRRLAVYLKWVRLR